MILSMIVAMDRNRTIGADNEMPWHLPDDLKHFKQNTLGKPVIMGRKTFESIGARPLPNRRNIVVTRNSSYRAVGADCVHSLDAAIALVNHEEEVVIMGGGQIYTQALPSVQKLYLTHVDTQVKGDTVFPDWTVYSWETVEQSHHVQDERHAYCFQFETLIRA